MSNKFDDWSDLPTRDCNECEEYWLNRCDGAKKGKETICYAYKAVKRKDIPKQIKKLDTMLKLSYALNLLPWAVVLTLSILCRLGVIT